MSTFENAPDATGHFDDVNTQPVAALTASVVSEADMIRHEALRSIISYPIELGYTGSPR
jgi:hypothetical protein